MVKTFKPNFKISYRITAGLTRIERARGFAEAARLPEAWVSEMGHRALILGAHHTTHIEGTQLTLDQAKQLLEGGSLPDADPDDVRELLNYKKAFEFISDYLADGVPITEGLVREIHQSWRKACVAAPRLPESIAKSRISWSTPSLARLYTLRLRLTMCRL